MNPERWRRLMRSWDLGGNDETFDGLVSAYSDPSRHYHSVAHVEACLGWLDEVVAEVEHPREVELGIWFHDVVYRPFASDNEERSAERGAGFLGERGADAAATSRVRKLILATRHDAAPRTRDESYLVDIDLAILGSEPEEYAGYERDVRLEYRRVPGFLYRRKRAALLRAFLDRGPIYRTEVFRDRREEQARANLGAAIERLEGGG